MEIPGYTIVRELGKGGMATVYLAIQKPLNRQVALKVTNPALANFANFAERFIKEGQIIAQFHHPQIITIYDFNTDGRHYYFSMEFLPGGTLSQKIKLGLTQERILTIIKLIAGALAYAHQRGVIHRDIKPQNILFREDDTPVLSDFGVAKVIQTSANAEDTQLTALGTVLGSPRYMSPEQITGQTLDARSDLYSLGIVFYEILAGRPLFQASDVVSLALMHCTEPIPALPVGFGRLQPILEKLLAKKVADRFENAEQLIRAIEQVESGAIFQPSKEDTAQTVPLVKTGAAEKTSSFIRRKPSLVIGGLLLSTMLVTVGVYLTLVRQDRAPDVTLRHQQQAEHFLAQARARHQQGDLAGSLKLLEQGLNLVPEQPELLRLRNRIRIELEEKNRIARLLQHCVGRFPLDRLSAEESAAAVACYQQILQLDSANPEGRAALEKIANAYADWANAALLRGDLGAAEDFLARLTQIQPAHPLLPNLSRDLRDIQARRIQETEEIARRQAAEEARRQAEEEAQRQATETARRQAEEETRRQATEEARRKAAEEETRRQAAEEARRKAAEQPRRPATQEPQRRPPVAGQSTNHERRCGDILSRITLGEPVSNQDRAFLTKECR
ncbi:MAG: serine/threonine protein kinase [Candidatus Competibacteraceae bacterium]|nr:MAG: serine/threonine protein kinase [Candidatus Competibacteraceae bacterium]